MFFFLFMLVGLYALVSVNALVLTRLAGVLRIPNPSHDKSVLTIILGCLSMTLSAWMFQYMPIVGQAAPAVGFLAYTVVAKSIFATSFGKALVTTLVQVTVYAAAIFALAAGGAMPDVWDQIKWWL